MEFFASTFQTRASRRPSVDPCGCGVEPVRPNVRRIDRSDLSRQSESMPIRGLRSSHKKVGGIVFFGRTIDKRRLPHAGRLPADYNVGTADRTFFVARCTKFLGVEYEAPAKRVVTEGGTDKALLEWGFRHGCCPRGEAIEVWNGFKTERGWNDVASSGLAECKCRCDFADRADILTWFDLSDVDENEVEKKPTGRSKAKRS